MFLKSTGRFQWQWKSLAHWRHNPLLSPIQLVQPSFQLKGMQKGNQKQTFRFWIFLVFWKENQKRKIYTMRCNNFLTLPSLLPKHPQFTLFRFWCRIGIVFSRHHFHINMNSIEFLPQKYPSIKGLDVRYPN